MWQQTLRTTLLALAATVVAATILTRVGGIPLPFRGIFPIVIVLVVAPTLFWWAWVDQRLVEAGRHLRAGAGLRVLVWSYTAAMLSPLLGLRWHGLDVLPVPVLIWMMIWHMLLMILGLGGLTIWVLCLVGRVLRPGPSETAAEPGSAKAVGPLAAGVTSGPSRRSFLATALGLAPLLVVGTTVAGGLRQQGRFRVRRTQIRLSRLPERLRGLTITHVSDLHLGRLFRPEHLPALVDAVNGLDSDLIAFTGDAVDHSFDYLPVACEAFGQMQSRYGRFIVAGNHDLIDSPEEAVDYLRTHEPNFLSDNSADINIGGEPLRIAGLSWSRYDRAQPDVPGHSERFNRMLASADPHVFTLALAHHPHAFDPLAAAGVDLTLAGHTHGGQIMLTPPGSEHPIGGGNLLFRYIWGEYRRGNAAMYVTSGVGNWYPLRINAPAEIVQIRLT